MESPALTWLLCTQSCHLIMPVVLHVHVVNTLSSTILIIQYIVKLIYSNHFNQICTTGKSLFTQAGVIYYGTAMKNRCNYHIK